MLSLNVARAPIPPKARPEIDPNDLALPPILALVTTDVPAIYPTRAPL